MNVKKAIIEETEVVKQLDAEKRSFKEVPVGGRRPNSPPISTKSSFVFQPLDEYPTSSGSTMDDPDVWRPPSRDTSRKPSRAGQVGSRKSSQDGTWGGRGPTRTAGRGGKTGASSKVNTGVRSSTAGKKGTTKAGKSDSVVGHAQLIYVAVWVSFHVFVSLICLLLNVINML